MKLIVASLAAVALLLGGGAASADTALVEVTPQTLKDANFTVTSKASRNHTVEFVIRRDVRNIDGPGRRGYLSHPAVDGKGLGTPVKLEEDGTILTFRFSVPADRLAGSVFTLWGQGLGGEGVTYRFRLADFRKSKKD
jgi:hypothetical protein